MKTISLSKRMALLQPSPTLAISAKAKAMQCAGQPVLSFSIGEPDFNTPEPICEAAIRALKDGQTKYTASSGTPALKEAICRKLEREESLIAHPDQIVVSCGAKHSLYNAMLALVNPGDEVILIAPYWMTYADQVRLAGGEPVVIHALPEKGLVPTLDQIQAAISPRTRAIVLNSPCNPTGVCFPRELLQSIARLAVERDLWLISDEIYERLVYDGEQNCVAALGEDIRARTIHISGCSKTYSMTGWRIGFAMAPVPVAKAMATLQDQVTSNPTSFAQAGAVTAFDLPESEHRAMRQKFQKRRDLITGLLKAIPGLDFVMPQGAFYVFPRVERYLRGKLTSDSQLAEFLLDQALVATVPGSVFEGPGHLRLSYATSRETIEEGVCRIQKALTELI